MMMTRTCSVNQPVNKLTKKQTKYAEDILCAGAETEKVQVPSINTAITLALSHHSFYFFCLLNAFPLLCYRLFGRLANKINLGSTRLDPRDHSTTSFSYSSLLLYPPPALL
eukprot:GHVT01092707.1.p1 GENE.GHVT01092707.1~~GHVT01092707.1.p1  ORF type:complete len:111 (-),score=1.60 GHVT01092707.1:890-1222(-)